MLLLLWCVVFLCVGWVDWEILGLLKNPPRNFLKTRKTQENVVVRGCCSRPWQGPILLLIVLGLTRDDSKNFVVPPTRLRGTAKS